MTEQQFEIKTWAEAEVTPGPGRDAELEQDQDQDDDQADEATDSGESPELS
jgi:hypothetical protein